MQKLPQQVRFAICLDPEISGPFVVIDETRVSLDQLQLEGAISKNNREQFGWCVYVLREMAVCHELKRLQLEA